MSFLKRIFGGGDKASSAPEKPTAEHEHEGYSIAITPMKDGGQFRVCGVISKEIDGARKEHKFIRADLFPSQEECADATLRKAKQVIREQGDGVFR